MIPTTERNSTTSDTTSDYHPPLAADTLIGAMDKNPEGETAGNLKKVMEAIVYTQYGAPSEVLQLKEIEKPTPKDNEVLIRTHAASVNAADWRLVRADPFLARFATGLLKPKNTIPGADVAGRVEAVGRNVTLFRPGDEVFGDLSACGWGAFAEYVCASENALVLKPANIPFEQAAAVPLAAVTALQGLRDKGQIQAGRF